MHMNDYVFEVTLDETLYRSAVRLADRRRQAVANVVQDLVRKGLQVPSLDRTGMGKRIRDLAPPVDRPARTPIEDNASDTGTPPGPASAADATATSLPSPLDVEAPSTACDGDDAPTLQLPVVPPERPEA